MPRVWYEVWGRQPGDAEPCLLYKLAAAVCTRQDAEEAAERERQKGTTEVEVKEVTEG